MTLPVDFKTKYGPWAIVTGASSGIGAEYCKQLAATGISLVLVARREERLKSLAKELVEKYPVDTKIIPADLSKEEGWRTVVEKTEGVDVGLLVNSAGLEQVGSFFHDSMDQHNNLIAVNVIASTALAHAIGRRMVDNGRGGIIFISSLLAEPSPWFSVYSASKSYISTLSVVLKEEFAPKGVHVTVVEPGVVKTDMSLRAGEAVDFDRAGFKAQSVEECVREGLEAFYAEKPKIITGMMNRINAFIMGILPEGMRMKMMSGKIDSVLRPEYKEYA